MATLIDARKLIEEFAKANKHILEFKFINEDPNGIEIEDVGGFINYVYRVSSFDKEQSVIIKHGKMHVKKIPTDQIPLERQQLEYEGLKLMNSILPGSAPKPYCLDVNYNIIAMEDVNGWELLMSQVDGGNVDKEVPINLGYLLAKLHQSTLKSEVSSKYWEELRLMRQRKMKSMMGGYLWKRPYIENDEITKIPGGLVQTYRRYVREILSSGYDKKMIDLYEEEHCYIHADCHAKAIFVKDGNVKLFDLEFAFLSHPAQNVAFVAVAYFFCYLMAFERLQNQGSSKKTLSSINVFEMRTRQALTRFLDKYLTTQTYMLGPAIESFLMEVCLFTGGILFAKSVFGPRHAYIPEGVNLSQFHTGFRLIRDHESVTSVGQLVAILFDGVNAREII